MSHSAFKSRNSFWYWPRCPLPISPVPIGATLTAPPRMGPRVNAAAPNATSAGAPAATFRKLRRPIVFCSSVRFMMPFPSPRPEPPAHSLLTAPPSASLPEVSIHCSIPFPKQIQPRNGSRIERQQDANSSGFDQRLVDNQIRAFVVGLRHTHRGNVEQIEHTQKKECPPQPDSGKEPKDERQADQQQTDLDGAINPRGPAGVDHPLKQSGQRPRRRSEE